MSVQGVSVDRERLGWWLAALGLVAAVAYVVASFLGTFLLGVFVYYATRPIYRRLERRIHQPTLTTVVALFGVSLPGLLLLGYTITVAVRELSRLVGTSIDEFTGILGPYIDTSILLDSEQLRNLDRGSLLDALPTGSADALQEVVGSLISAVSIFASVVLGMVITLVVAFYLLRDDEGLAKWFRTEVVSTDSTTYRFAVAVDRDLETVYFGNILTAFVIAIVAAVVYHLLNAVFPPTLTIPSPTLVGLLTGLASLVPVVGMKLVYFPIAAVMAGIAANNDPALLWAPAVFLLVSLVVVDTIPEVILRPYVSGRDLHTGLVMLAYILGPVLFGWYGLFLGPLLLVLIVHFVQVVLPELVDADRVPRSTPAVSSGSGPPAGSTGRSSAPGVAPPFAPISRRTDHTATDGDPEAVGNSGEDGPPTDDASRDATDATDDPQTD